MNTAIWLPWIGAALLLVSAAVLGCAWWYQRKLSRLQQRLDKARFAASQFADQAKRQIGQLQKELSERPKVMPVQSRPAHDDASDRKKALEDTLGRFTAPAHKLPVDGFADTQPM